MPTDLSVNLEDRPGALAKLGEALGQAGINLLGGCGVSCGGEGAVHFLVDDPAAARRALQGAGISVQGEQPVLLVSVADKPGGLGQVARKLAQAGVNITLLYISTRGQLVLGADNLDKARSVV